ncbi:MAG: hypothetical protein ABI597_11300 [Gammaproteobacteria bacterium]
MSYKIEEKLKIQFPGKKNLILLNKDLTPEKFPEFAEKNIVVRGEQKAAYVALTNALAQLGALIIVYDSEHKV